MHSQSKDYLRTPFERKDSVMEAFIEYIIPHKALLPGTHSYNFNVNRSFFEQFEKSPILDSNIHIEILLDKRIDMLVLDFDISGHFKGACDRCLVDIDVPISGVKSLMIKYSEELLDEEEEIVYISALEQQVNIAKFIYEFVILSLPLGNRRDCKEENFKNCDRDLLRKLDETAIVEKEQNSGSQWDALKNINFES